MGDPVEKKKACSSGSTYLRGLREIRRQKALTQRQLAARAGAGQGTVSKLERLERGAYPGTAWRLAEALGVYPADLMRGHRPE